MLPETNTEVKETTESTEETGGVQGTVSQETELPKWMAQNAGDNKTNERLSGFKTIDEVSNAYLKSADELAALREGKVFVPGEDATDEEKKAFLTSIGVPEESSMYKKVDSTLPEGVGFTEDQFNSLREMAFTAGWTEKQFSAYQEWSDKETLAARENYSAVLTKGKAEAEKRMKEDWGSDYDANLRYMQKGVKEFGGDDFLNKLGAAGNVPEVINFLVEKGRSGKNDTFLDGELDNKTTLPKNQISYPSMKGM